MPSANTTPTTLATDLRRLGLNRTADDLNDRIAAATRKRWSHTVLLEHLVAAELEDRQRRSLERRLTCARLGRFKPLADWASVDRSNPAISGHRKSGHFRRPETGVDFYFRASFERKAVWTLVRQLRGPHLSTWA